MFPADNCTIRYLPPTAPPLETQSMSTPRARSCRLVQLTGTFRNLEAAGHVKIKPDWPQYLICPTAPDCINGPIGSTGLARLQPDWYKPSSQFSSGTEFVLLLIL